MDQVLASAVSVVVVNGYNGTVDGQLLEVGAAMAVELSIQVREESPL